MGRAMLQEDGNDTRRDGNEAEAIRRCAHLRWSAVEAEKGYEAAFQQVDEAG